MMRVIDRPTMLRIVGTLDSNSSAGYDGISPALLKAVLTSEWTIQTPRTPEDDLRERIDLKFNASFQKMRDDLNYTEGTAQALRRVPDSKPQRDTIKMPNLAQTVTLRILNLCSVHGTSLNLKNEGLLRGYPNPRGS